jgi:hypothetical protein
MAEVDRRELEEPVAVVGDDLFDGRREQLGFYCSHLLGDVLGGGAIRLGLLHRVALLAGRFARRGSTRIRSRYVVFSAWCP